MLKRRQADRLHGQLQAAFRHTRQAALSTAVAGFVFALGPGHNIPLLGNTRVVGKGIVLLLAITMVSAFVKSGIKR